MEFLRDEDIRKIKSLTQTSEYKTIIDSGAKTESRLEDSAVELETPEAWPDQQGRNKKESNDRWLKWIQVTGG